MATEDNNSNNNGTQAAQVQQAAAPSPEVTVQTTGGTTRADVQTVNDPLTDVLNSGKENPAGEGTPENAENADAAKNTEDAVQREWEQQKKTEQDVKTDLASKGVDFDALAAEYDRDGALSQKSLDALAQAGYPKSVVDAYIDGLEARAERFVSTVKGFAGGDAEFEKVRTFLSSQPQPVIEGFNNAIRSGNLAEIRLAVEGVKASMVKAYGTSNPTIMAGNAGAGAPAGYTTLEQMTKDMSDPRYQKDPAFTREVIRKIDRATFF